MSLSSLDWAMSMSISSSIIPIINESAAGTENLDRALLVTRTHWLMRADTSHES